jgi:hypothetical protein
MMFAKLAAEMLRKAGSEFETHNYNDFCLDEFLDREEQLIFSALASKYNGDDREEALERVKNLPYASDFSVMYTLASILERS